MKVFDIVLLLFRGGPLFITLLGAAYGFGLPLPLLLLKILPAFQSCKDACFTIYDDKREEIIKYVSAYGLLRQSNKGIYSSNEV